MISGDAINLITTGGLDSRLKDIYVDSTLLEAQKDRYVRAINEFINAFGDGDIEVYSAPGRTEIGGNHTDHQHGQVIAAAVNLDAIAVVRKNSSSEVNVISEGFDKFSVSLSDLTLVENEKGSTKSLVKGVLCGLLENNYLLGGFDAYITSDVLIGAGLSSSASFETLIGTIVSGLFNNMSIPEVTIAKIGQYAENKFFGKPCGLMDQMASSVGSLVHIDFADTDNPVVERIDFDMDKFGYSLCITDTKGSHADLTSEYAAVPAEMKKVAAIFGKDVLLGISEEDIYSRIDEIREVAGDRAVLRALHFIGENKRVELQAKALRDTDIDTFLRLVKESGNSSYKYLQNVYSSMDVSHQNVSLALCISESYLESYLAPSDKNQSCIKGVSRIHGGGFAGTIQAFVRNEYVDGYRDVLEKVFKEKAVSVLKIRSYGGIKVL